MTLPNHEIQNAELRQVLAGPTKPAPIPDALVEKMVTVWAGVKRIEKTGRHPQGWKFATESDIADQIRELCAEAGIILIPNLVQHTEDEIGRTSNGNPIWRHNVVVDWTVTAGDDATIVRRWRGQADDSSDKGLNKAYTANRKTFLISLFQVSSGDDPDSHQPDAPVRQQSGRRGTGGTGDLKTPSAQADPPNEQQRAEYARLRIAITTAGRVAPDAFDAWVAGRAEQDAGGRWGDLNIRQFETVLDLLREQATKLLGEDFDPETGEVGKGQGAPAPAAPPPAPETPSEAPTSPDVPAPAPAPQAPDAPPAPAPAPVPAPAPAQPSIPGVREPGSTLAGAREIVAGSIGVPGLMEVIERLKTEHGAFTPNDLDADPLHTIFTDALSAAIEAHAKAPS